MKSGRYKRNPASTRMKIRIIVGRRTPVYKKLAMPETMLMTRERVQLSMAETDPDCVGKSSIPCATKGAKERPTPPL